MKKDGVKVVVVIIPSHCVNAHIEVSHPEAVMESWKVGKLDFGENNAIKSHEDYFYMYTVVSYTQYLFCALHSLEKISLKIFNQIL